MVNEVVWSRPTDSSFNTNKKVHSPQKATLKSLILPGWGQYYNQQCWKIPIVATGITIPIVTYFQNNNRYKEAASAYRKVYGSITDQGGIDQKVLDGLPKAYQNLYEDYRDNPAVGRRNVLYNIQEERRYYRKNRDYSILWLAILWGLNVVDATVSGHLKDFNVDDNLSIKIHSQPTMSGNSLVIGISKSIP